MSDETAEKRSTLTQLKSLGDVVRLWGVLVIAILAVLNPTFVKSWVRDAGIKKLLDVEFSEADAKRIEAQQQGLKDSRLVIDQLGEDLNQVQKALTEAQAGGEPPAELARQLERTQMAVQLAERSKEQISNTLAKATPLAQKAQAATGTTSTSWGVIFGGDADLEQARWEVDRAAKDAEPERKRFAIFLRDGSYRSVAQYGSREEAEAVLPRFSKLRSSAYVVPLDRWCSKRTEADGFFRCG